MQGSMQGQVPRCPTQQTSSDRWYELLQSAGAEDVLQAQCPELAELSGKCGKPFWLLLVRDVLPDSLRERLCTLLPQYVTQQLGKRRYKDKSGKHQCVKGWSMFPCSCRYPGSDKKHAVYQYGKPGAGDEHVCPPVLRCKGKVK